MASEEIHRATRLPSLAMDNRDTEKYAHTKHVGNYLVGATLGEGAFAQVKEGLHIPTGEKVAIKIINKRQCKNSYIRKNLHREGKLLQMVRHPNIVQLYETMETERGYYLVLELCRGGGMMEYISQKEKLTERETQKFMCEIVSAANHLHQLGILHRDLKTENLLLDDKNSVKLVDFGLSNTIKTTKSKTGSPIQHLCLTQCGSPAYAAPELLSQKRYGPEVDVWSIGVVMYAMLTGGLPFTVEPFNIKNLHNKMISGQMNPIPDTFSTDCVHLLHRLLTPDPERRIQLKKVMEHPWITGNVNTPILLSYPNHFGPEDLNKNILSHMSENQGNRKCDMVWFIVKNIPSDVTATYQLLQKKLVRCSADKEMAPASLKSKNSLRTRQASEKNTDKEDRTPNIQAQKTTDTDILLHQDVENQKNQSLLASALTAKIRIKNSNQPDNFQATNIAPLDKPGVYQQWPPKNKLPVICTHSANQSGDMTSCLLTQENSNSKPVAKPKVMKINHKFNIATQPNIPLFLYKRRPQTQDKINACLQYKKKAPGMVVQKNTAAPTMDTAFHPKMMAHVALLLHKQQAPNHIPTSPAYKYLQQKQLNVTHFAARWAQQQQRTGRNTNPLLGKPLRGNHLSLKTTSTVKIQKTCHLKKAAFLTSPTKWNRIRLTSERLHQVQSATADVLQTPRSMAINLDFPPPPRTLTVAQA